MGSLDATGLVLVIAALGGMLVSVIGAVFAGLMAWRANANSLENGRKADTIIEKAVEIHTLTNGTNSQLQKALEVANTKIEGFEKLMAAFLSAKHEADAALTMSRTDVAAALALPPPRPPAALTRGSDQAPQKVEVVNQPLLVKGDGTE